LSIYSSFAGDADKRQFGEVRRTPAAELGKRDFGFRDPRYAELLFRYRARNWPATLDSEETARWQAMRRRRLESATPATPRTLEDFFAEIAAVRALETTTPAQHVLLDQLEQWGHSIL
jgi:exodeoxyribonuclease-1